MKRYRVSAGAEDVEAVQRCRGKCTDGVQRWCRRCPDVQQRSRFEVVQRYRCRGAVWRCRGAGAEVQMQVQRWCKGGAEVHICSRGAEVQRCRCKVQRWCRGTV